MRRSPLYFRLVAALLAVVPGLAGPGAALAHGVAHVREHRAADHHERDDHHAPHLLDRLMAIAHGHAQDDGAHGHPRLDAQAISRLAPGLLPPALPTLVPPAPVIVATVAAPPAASPLRLADPPTGPPPPSRAPPHG